LTHALVPNSHVEMHLRHRQQQGQPHSAPPQCIPTCTPAHLGCCPSLPAAPDAGPRTHSHTSGNVRQRASPAAWGYF